MSEKEPRFSQAPRQVHSSSTQSNFKRGWRCFSENHLQVCLNPLTPGAFCKKRIFWTFWRFSGWISAKLALIWLKMHLQHDSLPFLPLASGFMTFWLGHALKSKVRDVLMSLGFSIFEIFFSSFLFLLFFCFRCSDWPSTGLAWG